MHTKTVSKLTDHTTFYADAKSTDGGRALLIEAFDFIRSEKGTGKITLNLTGGSISGGVIFEESTSVTQKDRLEDVE